MSKLTVESLMTDHPDLWSEFHSMPIDRLAVLVELMNGETFEPAGRETATCQLDKEDAAISSLKLDYLIPISSVKTGIGNRVMHIIRLDDLNAMLRDRENQKRQLKRKHAQERQQRTEKDIKRSVKTYGIKWTLKRAKAANRKLRKSASNTNPELEKCIHCEYEQLAEDLFHGGCIQCGEFNESKKPMSKNSQAH